MKQLTLDFRTERWFDSPVVPDSNTQEQLVAHMSDAIISICKKGETDTDDKQIQSDK